jgi:aminoglycoside 3-N-acetyltransferase
MKRRIAEFISARSYKRVVVHSDIRFGFGIDPSGKTRRDLLAAHCSELAKVFRGLQMIMPAFNYDFSKTKLMDVRATPGQVGVLNEYFRKNCADWRTAVPVFSFAGTGAKPACEVEGVVNPLGSRSLLALFDREGTLVAHYGSRMGHTTFLHYIEEIRDVPYRYNKQFHGDMVFEDGRKEAVIVEYKVRPLDGQTVIDWDRLLHDLQHEMLALELRDDRAYVLLLDVAGMCRFWKEKLSGDPLYFLNSGSRVWVAERLAKLGRMFRLSDFERI